MYVLSIRITEQSVIAVAEHMRRDCPSKATFSEEIALVQNAYRGFLPGLRHNGELYLSSLYIKNSVGRVALNKDLLSLEKRSDLPTAVNHREKCLGIKLAEIVGRYHSFHDRPPFKSSECPEGNFL